MRTKTKNDKAMEILNDYDDGEKSAQAAIRLINKMEELFTKKRKVGRI